MLKKNKLTKILLFRDEQDNLVGTGAGRAAVLSDQAFYYRVWFALSSEVYRWEKVNDKK